MKITYRNLTLATLLSLFLINISFAQEFAPLGAKWYFPIHHCCSSTLYLMTYESVGDTVINNKSCRILYKDFGTINGGSGNYYFHQSSDTIYQYDELNDTFDMIIDFGAMSGDTFQIEKNKGNGFLDTAYCIVDSISYINISANDSLRVQNVIQVDIYDYGKDTFKCSKRIIERIGFNYALMPLQLFSLADNLREGEIRCYEGNEVG